ncbi:hypothetical protein AVEN_56411-1 [Araneus ventricosus]|uniref:Uncharacterized protein n=1 Tax=Araneus ventricosus TaxID=182803 RepID=A0A4Y2GLR7_ARAVE|nr:hypothetical protein AVEN_56411-1 [Araneus ventricosus]
MQDGSSVKSGFKPGTLQPQGRDLISRPPRPTTLKKKTHVTHELDSGTIFTTTSGFEATRGLFCMNLVILNREQMTTTTPGVAPHHQGYICPRRI